MKRALQFIFIFIILSNSLQSQDFSKIDSLFESWNQDNHPGGAIAIIDDQEIIYAKGFGLASLEYQIPITEETVFNTASVSKQFTAFSMILLDQQGKLSLDDDIRKYVPEVPDFGTTITIRHLAHHISGLRNFQNLLVMAGWREGDAMTNGDLLKYIRWQQELNFPVGSEYLYCNTGFNLMATIVERVTGQSFIDWTKEYIFLPLGMMHTTFRNDMTQVVANTATSYEGATGGPFTVPKPFWDYMGNGNLYSTVGDLTKWMINFSSHQVGGTEGYEQLTQRGVLTSGDTIGYAFGINVNKYRGLHLIRHGGSIGGYRAELGYFPDHELGVVILANYSNANPGAKARAIADILLEAYVSDQASQPDPVEQMSTDPFDLSVEKLQRFKGHFDLGDFLVEFFLEGDTLIAKGPQGPPLPMTPTSDTSFFLAAAGYHVLFHPDSDGKVNTLTAYSPDRTSGARIDPAWREVDNMTQYVGNYYSPELKTSYTLAINEGQLEMRHTRHHTFHVIPFGENELRGDFWFFGNIKVVRNGAGEVIGIRVSNGRVRNLWFEKKIF